MAMRPHLIVPATAKHTATVIFLHGLGDSGHGMAEIVNIIGSPHVKYVCPHAPMQPVSINFGEVMPSWFDIKGFQVNSEVDEAGIKSAANRVHQWLDKEIKADIPSNRIALAGFSQGGALSLYSGFTYNKQLGITHKLDEQFVKHQERKENLNIPIFQGHGDLDPLTKLDVAQHYVKHIQTFNQNHTFKVYKGMAHQICEQEMDDMKEFFEKILPPL